MSKQNRLLRILNARENNLKQVSLDIPHDTFVGVTGLSGSGKSSLAFDTVYAEGQRRYIETFSPYTRQFLDKVKKPDVDHIANVRPAVAIQQRVRIVNSRSTVGSVTNINDYLKIVWSTLAEAVCPTCEIPLRSWSADALAEHLRKMHQLKPDTVLLIGFPLRVPEKGRKAQLAREVSRLLLLGFSRYFDPRRLEVAALEEGVTPHLTAENDLLVILDRIKGETVNLRRLRENLDQAFSHSRGIAVAIEQPEGDSRRRPLLTVYQNPDQDNRAADPFTVHTFSTVPRCSEREMVYARPRQSLFSFNHPLGACPNCKGFGNILKVDPALCVPNPMLTIKNKALQCWSGSGTTVEYKDLLRFCKEQDIPVDRPWAEIGAADREKIFSHKSKTYWGVLPWFGWLERRTYKMHVRVFLSRYRSQVTCPECDGTRLKRDALAYRVAGRTLPDIWRMSVGETLAWMRALGAELKEQRSLPRQVFDVINATVVRLQFLVDLGLEYLTLDRQARTLSGGETQRVNLAAALGSELVSTHFVLDEPSVGLHARDTRRLISAVRDLQSRGNSLLVVEHDEEFLNSADHIVELGPLAGEHGGEIVFSGPAAEWGGIALTAPERRDADLSTNPALRITKATARNLKGIDLTIPLNAFVCLTGVSGSGKSTLVREVIERRYQEAQIGLKTEDSENLVSGFEQVEQVILVDQSALSKSPRANIATYSDIWEQIRELLSRTADAQTRALSKSSFSFNVDGGRCPACSGAGFIREDMQFLSDVYIPCDTCLGKRFQQTVLEVRYRGVNVDELLNFTLERCAEFFHDHSFIRTNSETLCRLGLGHLTLGHPLSELSGGEAQRLKLVPFLQRGATKRSLLIFDEPTTGLHYHDVQRLVALISSLVEGGHSVLCVEHNLSLALAADWIIDLGPEGGDGGGSLVVQGTPADLLKNGAPGETARYLREYAARAGGKKRGAASRAKVKRIQPEEQPLMLRGAREHNLKNISLTLPLGRLIALTGVSGSGKSSIAKDIIYAEGQRRYLDCLSPYARQFIKELKRPEIESIQNVPPTICVYQHTFQPSALSTVGTMSEVYNYLRLLFVKTGVQHCPDHPGERIAPLGAEEIARDIKSLPAATIRLLAPMIKLKKGLHKPLFERALASEISEVRVDGSFAPPSRFAQGLAKTKPHSIDYVVAKFSPSRLGVDLILEAVRQGLSLSGGTLIAHTGDKEVVYSTERTCPICKRGFFKADPEDLSFHSKRGRCEVCNGTGTGKNEAPCAACGGSRLNPVGRNIRLGNLNIAECAGLPAPRLAEFLSALDFQSAQRAVAEPVLRELHAKLGTLSEIGLDYLALSRDCRTLSGGELQRLRLGTAMGSPLAGVMYIFDEPSVGLHPADNVRVLERLQRLKESGNSVIVIEHDPQSILACEYVVDIGPGGGTRGGEIVYQGETAGFLGADSLTARCLNEDRSEIAAQLARPRAPAVEMLRLTNGTRNNISGLNLELPLGALLSVVGVSGAGKSTLVHSLISDTVTEGKKKEDAYTLNGAKLTSSLPIERVLLVDQKPIGATSRSTPASYLGIWDEVRKLFAGTIEAKSRGWKVGHFSYNSGKGRCPTCKGLGNIKIEMSFLPDSVMQCEACMGRRFTDETLAITYQGVNVHQVLSMTFEEARATFANHRRIHQPLHQACELGLGYLTLGQNSASLSGGECQRIKLVSEMSSPRKGHTLYILDEPTTGLHKSDVAKLVKVLRSLVVLGHSVLLIEHDLDVIAASDHVVELGPGPGERGGRVLFSGTPDKLTGCATPWGQILERILVEGEIAPMSGNEKAL